MKKITTMLAMILMVTLTQAQTFGSFGPQLDTVTALYYSSGISSNLYIGAQSQTDIKRAKYYDGININTMSFVAVDPNPNIVTRKISAIGRLNNNDIFYVDEIGSFSTFYNYNGSWSTSTSLSVNYKILSTLTDDYAASNNTICGTTDPSFFKTQIYNGVSLVKYPNVNTGGPQTGLENYNGTVYGGMNTGYLAYFDVGAWVSLSTWFPGNLTNDNGKFLKSCAVGSTLYIVSRKTLPGSPTSKYQDYIYALNGSTITGPILTSPLYPTSPIPANRYYEDMEEFNGKLYICGRQLLSYDGSTFDTLVNENEFSTGQIYVLETYGDKLAIGGSFTNLKGNTTLNYLAYLTYVTTSVSDVKKNIETHVTVTGDKFKSDTDWTMYDMSGRTIMNGGPGTYSLKNTGLYIISTKYGAQKYFKN